MSTLSKATLWRRGLGGRAADIVRRDSRLYVQRRQRRFQLWKQKAWKGCAGSPEGQLPHRGPKCQGPLRLRLGTSTRTGPLWQGWGGCIKVSATRELEKVSQWPRASTPPAPTLGLSVTAPDPPGPAAVTHDSCKDTEWHRQATDIREGYIVHTELEPIPEESGSDGPPCCSLQRWWRKSQWGKLNMFWISDLLLRSSYC